MTLQVTLTGGGHGEDVHIHRAQLPLTEYNGLVAYTEPLHTRTHANIVLTGSTGIDLNIDPTVAGTTTLIHDGADNFGWTASAEAGVWTFDSTAQAYSGTKSVEATSVSNADVAVFTAGAPLSVATVQEVNLWVYIDKWSTTGNKDFLFSFRNGGATISNKVSLKGYVSTSAVKTWQRVAIPLTAFGVSGTTVNAFAIEVVNSGGTPPDVFFDDIELNTGTSAQIFKAAPGSGEIWEVHNVRFTTVSTGTTLNHNEFFGLPRLTNGILFQGSRAVAGPRAVIFNELSQMMTAPSSEIHPIVGTANITTSLDFAYADGSFVLEGDRGDFIQAVVRDDLSTLPYFRIVMRVSRLELT